jgi:hypothetical protein
MYRLHEGERKQHWKYNAGDTFRVARLPVAIFSRTIPNVETNVRVKGITYHSQAIYFLPEKVLIIDGSNVRNVDYSELGILVDSLEYVEAEGHVYRDSLVIDKRWKFINRDGSPDRRFKDNFELPVVRCGLLGLEVGGVLLQVMTTNPQAPAIFQGKLGALIAEIGQQASSPGPPVRQSREANTLPAPPAQKSQPAVSPGPAISLTCPHCQGQVGLDPRIAGPVVLCPYCQQRLQMPTWAG